VQEQERNGKIYFSIHPDKQEAIRQLLQRRELENITN
jgi:hypothetical protein